MQEPAPKTEPSAPIKWQELQGDAISFVRMHPGAAQKNTYVEWKHYAHPETGEKVWRVNGKDGKKEMDTLLSALKTAATQSLIASDGIYTCRHRENMPQYRLEFQHEGKSYRIISSSDCQYGAPFNVMVDGEWFIQLTGEVGQALALALEASGISLKVGETPAVFMLADPIVVQGYEAKAKAQPTMHFDASFRADATFGGVLKYLETLFGPLKQPEVACNQAKRANCADVTARYTVEILPGMTYLQPLKFNAGAVEAKFPTQTEFEYLAQARENIGLKAYAEAYAKSGGIQVSWHDGGDCKMVKGLAKHFEYPETISCSYWQFSAKEKPTAIYYTGLKSFWIEPGESTQAYVDAICSMPTLPKADRAKICAKKAPHAPIIAGSNVFVRSSGKVLKFVTEKGVTRVE